MTALCLALISGVTAQEVDQEARVRRAVAAAVEARLGAVSSAAVDLRLQEVTTSAPVDGAEPEPGGRLGRPSRFRLLAQGRSAGYAVAVVHVVVPHVRVVQGVAAAVTVTAADVMTVTGDPGAQPIDRLPSIDTVIGAAAVRALHAGEVVTGRNVRVPPAVRSGEAVTVRVVVEGVEATGAATALQTGEIGDVIRMVNPESRRQLRGRVVGRAQVEVKHES